MRRRIGILAGLVLLPLMHVSAVWAQTLSYGSPGPHVLGGYADPNSQLTLRGYFSSPSADTRALDVTTTLQGFQGLSVEGINLRPAFLVPTDGTRANNFEGLDILLTVPPGVGSVAQVDGILMRTFTVPPGTGYAVGIYIYGPPSGADTNLSLWVAGGESRFTGPVTLPTLAPGYACINAAHQLVSQAQPCQP